MTDKPIDSELVEQTVDTVLDENPQLVDGYYIGEHGAINNLVNKVVQESEEAIPPRSAYMALKSRLDGER